MPYTALDVAIFTVQYCDKHDYDVNNYKLQKLLYFIQSYFLINTKHRCFIEPIIKTKFGICVPEVYEHFKQYGAGSLWTQMTKNIYVSNNTNNRFDVHKYDYDPRTIKTKDQKDIIAVIKQFKDYSNPDLNTLTWNQDPWNQTDYDHEITCECIYNYFSKE